MFLCIPHQSLMMRQSGQWITVRKDPHLKNATSASPHDSQETARLDEDSERSSVVGSVICGCILHMVSSLYSEGRSRSLLR